MQGWITACTLLALTAIAACASRPPPLRSPAVIARDEPCRFMGTVHKESRQRIEALRICGAISMDEWSCMASALERVDDEFTAACRSRPVAYAEIADRQRALHSACASRPMAAIIECALLSEPVGCVAIQCE